MSQNKKQILLQVYNFIYVYYGLAAIKTLFDDFDLDILLINSNDKEIALYKKYIQSFPQVKNIHIFSDEFCSQISNCIKKSLWGKIQFALYKKNGLIKKLNTFFKCQKYDEVFFCHENRNFSISAIKLCYPNAKFTMYGDGFGLFCSVSFDYYQKIHFENPYMIDEVIPNRAIALLPCDVDDIIAKYKIPIFTTNKNIMKELLKEPKEIKDSIDNYISLISTQFPKAEFCLFMTSCLAEVSSMKLNDEVKMNIEIIRTHFPPKSVIIIKPHPREQGTKVNLYKQILKDDYIIIELPQELQKLPIELMGKLLKKVKYFITYGTSFVTLKYGSRYFNRIFSYQFQQILIKILS